MERDNSNGVMDALISESFMRIKSKDLVYLLGLMEENMSEIGKRENNMDLENMFRLMGKKKLGNGSRGRDLIGLMKTKLKGKK